MQSYRKTVQNKMALLSMFLKETMQPMYL